MLYYLWHYQIHRNHESMPRNSRMRMRPSWANPFLLLSKILFLAVALSKSTYFSIPKLIGCIWILLGIKRVEYIWVNANNFNQNLNQHHSNAKPVNHWNRTEITIFQLTQTMHLPKWLMKISTILLSRQALEMALACSIRSVGIHFWVFVIVAT